MHELPHRSNLLPAAGQTTRDDESHYMESTAIILGTSIASDMSNVKVGNPLASLDMLMTQKQDREGGLLQLRDIYGINFTADTIGSPLLSLTTRKCLLSDTKGNIYFLKEKPDYSLSAERLYAASTLQIELSKRLPFIPPIIFTYDNKPYAKLRGKTVFLTPFIDGDLFIGKLEQSVSSAQALAEMHIASKDIHPRPEIETTTASLLSFIDMANKLNFPDQDLKQYIISEMKKGATKYFVSQNGSYGWIHCDFAPFNTVFRGNKVIALNDFDNAMYGPLAKDIAILLLNHCAINYAGTTSSLRSTIRTKVDIERMDLMLNKYVSITNNSIENLSDIPNQITSMWLKYMTLGLLRGDYSLNDVKIALPFSSILYTNILDLIRKYGANK